jgi:hypothetical protein
MTRRFTADGLTKRQALAVLVLGMLLGFGVLSLKAWLLLLVMGWFGITALGFWKAVVAILLLDLLIGAARSSK